MKEKQSHSLGIITGASTTAIMLMAAIHEEICDSIQITMSGRGVVWSALETHQ